MRSNAGYEIIEATTIGDVEFVLGERKTTVGAKYVTWERSGSPDNYYWGHYFDHYENAQKDLYERVKKECDYKIHCV